MQFIEVKAAAVARLLLYLKDFHYFCAVSFNKA
jgi:hypothetical protein